FKNDYKEVIDRAFDNGVKAILNIGSNWETSLRAIEIAKKYPSGVYAAVGLHPIHVQDEDFNFENLEKLAQDKKVVALGETGLDYYHGNGTKELQKEIFRKTITIANKIGKPLIFHSRDAGDDILSVFMEEKFEPKGVMHCFAGNWQFAKYVLDLGLYLSFTGLITFSKNYETFEVIKNMPLDRLMIETDCPYMTPEPYRGKRNEPAFVIEVAKKIAEIKKISVEEVAEQTSKNAIELFGLKLKEDTSEV
ncbi:MAG: hydrolase, TatD family, partial [Candidatus Berkelbacteria bacterium]|nr:hydrolase, TatD family [Candidatus Berkelbacteria bacterium]